MIALLALCAASASTLHFAADLPDGTTAAWSVADVSTVGSLPTVTLPGEEVGAWRVDAFVAGVEEGAWVVVVNLTPDDAPDGVDLGGGPWIFRAAEDGGRVRVSQEGAAAPETEHSAPIPWRAPHPFGGLVPLVSRPGWQGAHQVADLTLPTTVTCATPRRWSAHLEVGIDETEFQGFTKVAGSHLVLFDRRNTKAQRFEVTCDVPLRDGGTERVVFDVTVPGR